MLCPRLAAVVVLPTLLSACAQAGSASDAGWRGSAPAAVRTVTSAAVGQSETRPHPAMLRFPDVGPGRIVFVYADDLWIVPRAGGTASPLASPPGQELFPKFSADGATIAFVGNYDGVRDLYTIPTSGGVPTRVTYHPATETLTGWTPDGRLIYYGNGFAGLRRQTQLFTISPDGGLPTKLPPPYGANGAISPDGVWLAYTPHTRDARTWKRYRGGMATDIWLLNLKDHSSKKITDWEGTDSLPMWHGKIVYYLSDAGPNHRLNIWSYDTSNGRRKQITEFADYDVKWPSIGPGADGSGEIVFQNGGSLYLLSLSTGQSSEVHVTIPGDRPTIRPHDVDASKFVTGWDISSTGKRAVIDARGDVWTVPGKKGVTRNLTRTDGAYERDPSWSPDGQWIAYFSDATGEYELYITQSDGRGETKQLTKDGGVFRYSPTWSPDSKMIVFGDKTGAGYLHTIDTGETKLIDKDPWSRLSRASWAADSKWIAYAKSGDSQTTSIWLYEVATGAKTQVTSGMFNDTWPTFDRKGDYLFFASNRAFTSPVYEDVGQSWVYADTDILVVVPLRDEVGSPFAPKSDEEKWGDEKNKSEDEDDKDDDGQADKADDAGKDESGKPEEATAEEKREGDGGKDEGEEDEKKGDDKAEKEIKPVVLELDGFEERAIPIPIKKGTFGALAVSHDGKLIYSRGGARGSGVKPSIKIFDLKDEKKKEKTVVEGTGAFRISADGKKLLVRKDKKMAIVDAKAGQKLDKPLSLSAMHMRIDPREEWRQIFTDAWRIERDFFYDPHMHGVDWNAMRTRYEAMLEDCSSRRDVVYVIGELISELNVGHTYARGLGDVKRAPRVPVGMLGVDFELHNGAYRITRIYHGAPWDLKARGPLSQPGVDVKEGDYLLAVNDVPLDTAKDPWAAFQGLADKVVTLTVSENPIEDDKAREVLVKPLPGESKLRYRAWIEHNRKYVEDQTDGRVGYIYVPNTGGSGQNDLVRQFFGQIDKAAIIIDERWNGGGQIPTRFIELLNRPITNYWARRDGHDWPWPPDAHQGPKCMLINGLAGSGGDAFPAYFRQAKLGKLIGMRTWGGLVGYSGNPGLIDGGSITAPSFGFYEKNGTWGIEGYGVDPDIQVIDDPAKMLSGGDPQLDRAIAQMLEELKHHAYVPPKRPAYPNRSGMGVREEDK